MLRLRFRRPSFLVPLAACIPAALYAQSAGTRAPAATAPARGTPATAPASAPAQPAGAAASETEITLNNLELRLLPVAVPLLRGGSAAANEVTEVLSNDLRLSALFRVLDPRSFTANLETEGTGITPALWAQAGATSVVKGTVTGSGGDVRAEIHVWEPGRPAEPRLVRTFGPGNARAVAHQAANELLRLYTGRAGVFGTRLLFARRMGASRKDVFVVDCDGANLGQISPGRRMNLLPAWGPNGIYYSAQTREGFLALVRAGRPPVDVLRIDGMAIGASFAGNRLAVVLNRDGNPEIYSGNADGSNLRRLTNDGGADVSPAWSPGGDRIAFVSDREGTPQVYVMNADGSGVRRITTRGAYNQTPAWSPDGSTLAYASRAGDGYDLFAVNLGSGAVRRLTENQGSNTDPTYSPDGRLIAFSSSRGGIYLMNQDGMLQQRIVAGAAESLRWER